MSSSPLEILEHQSTGIARHLSVPGCQGPLSPPPPPRGGVLRGEAVLRVNQKRGRKADGAESLQVTLTQSLQGTHGLSHTH